MLKQTYNLSNIDFLGERFCLSEEKTMGSLRWVWGKCTSEGNCDLIVTEE
jgi:hypothetical protein